MIAQRLLQAVKLVRVQTISRRNLLGLAAKLQQCPGCMLSCWQWLWLLTLLMLVMLLATCQHQDQSTTMIGRSCCQRAGSAQHKAAAVLSLTSLCQLHGLCEQQLGTQMVLLVSSRLSTSSSSSTSQQLTPLHARSSLQAHVAAAAMTAPVSSSSSSNKLKTQCSRPSHSNSSHWQGAACSMLVIAARAPLTAYAARSALLAMTVVPAAALGPQLLLAPQRMVPAAAAVVPAAAATKISMHSK